MSRRPSIPLRIQDRLDAFGDAIGRFVTRAELQHHAGHEPDILGIQREAPPPNERHERRHRALEGGFGDVGHRAHPYAGKPGSRRIGSKSVSVRAFSA